MDQLQKIEDICVPDRVGKQALRYRDAERGASIIQAREDRRKLLPPALALTPLALSCLTYGWLWQVEDAEHLVFRIFFVLLGMALSFIVAIPWICLWENTRLLSNFENAGRSEDEQKILTEDYSIWAYRLSESNQSLHEDIEEWNTYVENRRFDLVDEDPDAELFYERLVALRSRLEFEMGQLNQILDNEQMQEYREHHKPQARESSHFIEEDLDEASRAAMARFRARQEVDGHDQLARVRATSQLDDLERELRTGRRPAVQKVG